jgi:UDP-N-acetylmuramate dehydrogenase
MEIKKNYNLFHLNTFGVNVEAKYFVEIRQEFELEGLLKKEEFIKSEKFFLGGGSNILFTKSFAGIVISNKLKGIEILEENEKEVFVRSMGGEVWNDLVMLATSRGWWGIENLAFIPGTVGGAPVQNIGAYGAEFKDVLENVEGVFIETGEKKKLTKQECGFGYRDSIFKNKLKGKFFITAVTIKLSKTKKENISYKVLQEYIQANNLKIENSKDVASAVTLIRKSKLPDPKIIPNAGSFFKNIILNNVEDSEKIKNLLTDNPTMPYFREEESLKIPSGWLIEQCGWKGKRVGNVGVHEKQALVIVNYGLATGEEIKNFARNIIDVVFSKFGLILTVEVNII